MIVLYLKKLILFLLEINNLEFLPIVERERERVSLLLGNLDYFNFDILKFYNVWAKILSPFYNVKIKPVCREV